MLSDYNRFRHRRTAPPDADNDTNTQSGSSTFTSKRHEENLDSNENTSDLGSSESSTNRLHYDPATLAVLESKSTRERDPHRFVRAANGVSERDTNSSPTVGNSSANNNSSSSSNNNNGSGGNAADSKVSLRGKSFGNFYGDTDDTDPTASDDWRNSLSSWRDRRKQMIVNNLSPEVAATVTSTSSSLSNPDAAAATVNGDAVLRPKAMPDASNTTNGTSSASAVGNDQRRSRIRSFNEMLKSHSHVVPVFDDDLSGSATQAKLETTPDVHSATSVSIPNTNHNTDDYASSQKIKSKTRHAMEEETPVLSARAAATETGLQQNGQSSFDSAKMRATSRRSDLRPAVDADTNESRFSYGIRERERLQVEAINKQQAPAPYVSRSYREQRELHTSALEREGQRSAVAPDASQLLTTSNHFNGETKHFSNRTTADEPERKPAVELETKLQKPEDNKAQLKPTQDSVAPNGIQTRKLFDTTSQSHTQSPSQSPKLGRHLAAPQPYTAAPLASPNHDALHSSLSGVGNNREFKAPETANGTLTLETVALSVSADIALETGPEVTVSPALQHRQLPSDSSHPSTANEMPLSITASSEGDSVKSGTSSPSLPGVSAPSSLLVVQDNRRRTRRQLDNSTAEQPVAAVEATCEPQLPTSTASLPSPPQPLSASAAAPSLPSLPSSASTAAPSPPSPPSSASTDVPSLPPPPPLSAPPAALPSPTMPSVKSSTSTVSDAARSEPAAVGSANTNGTESATPRPVPASVSALRKRPPRIDTPPPFAINRIAAANAAAAAAASDSAAGLRTAAPGPSNVAASPSMRNNIQNSNTPPTGQPQLQPALLTPAAVALTSDGDQAAAGRNKFKIDPASIGANVPNIYAAQSKPEITATSATTAVVVRQRQPPLAIARARQLQATSPGTNTNALGPAPMRVLPSQFSKQFSSYSNGSEQLINSNSPQLQYPALAAHTNGNGTNSNTSFGEPGVITSVSNRNQNVPTSGQQVCSGCRQALSAGSAMYIEQLKSMYHTDCFICSSCRCSLVSPDGVVANVYIRDQQLNCLACSSSSTVSRTPEALSQGLKGHRPLPPPAARVRSDASLYSSQPTLIQPQPNVIRPASGGLRPNTYV